MAFGIFDTWERMEKRSADNEIAEFLRRNPFPATPYDVLS